MTFSPRESCPVHRATDIIGDQWSLLIMREFFLEGPRRFQDLQEVLQVSPNTLSGRLKKLENSRVLRRETYSTNPPRAQYVLTDMGQGLAPVLAALRAWGESLPGDAS